MTSLQEKVHQALKAINECDGSPAAIAYDQAVIAHWETLRAETKARLNFDKRGDALRTAVARLAAWRLRPNSYEITWTQGIAYGYDQHPPIIKPYLSLCVYGKNGRGELKRHFWPGTVEDVEIVLRQIKAALIALEETE